jgi:hypothetical protein
MVDGGSKATRQRKWTVFAPQPMHSARLRRDSQLVTVNEQGKPMRKQHGNAGPLSTFEALMRDMTSSGHELRQDHMLRRHRHQYSGNKKEVNSMHKGVQLETVSEPLLYPFCVNNRSGRIHFQMTGTPI